MRFDKLNDVGMNKTFFGDVDGAPCELETLTHGVGAR